MAVGRVGPAFVVKQHGNQVSAVSCDLVIELPVEFEKVLIENYLAENGFNAALNVNNTLDAIKKSFGHD